MLRQAFSLVFSIGAGLAAIAALTREVGPVPSWLAFLCGILVTLASMAQLRVRINVGSEDPHGEHPPAGGGRHRSRDGGVGDRDDDDSDSG